MNTWSRATSSCNGKLQLSHCSPRSPGQGTDVIIFTFLFLVFVSGWGGGGLWNHREHGWTHCTSLTTVGAPRSRPKKEIDIHHQHHDCQGGWWCQAWWRSPPAQLRAVRSSPTRVAWARWGRRTLPVHTAGQSLKLIRGGKSQRWCLIMLMTSPSWTAGDAFTWLRIPKPGTCYVLLFQLCPFQ